MPILADIKALEARVAAILEAATVAGPEGERFVEVVTDAILSLLDGQDLADLTDTELGDLLREALEEAFPDWREAYYQAIAGRVDELLDLTEQFYRQHDVAVPASLREAVRRSQTAQRLTDALEVGMRTINDDLRERTVEILQEAIATGNIDRREIRREVEKRAGATEFQARVQTHAALAAYNQTYRNELAGRAQLEHFYYDGFLQRNSRPFCRIHINRVFTAAQIAQMDNGMLNPVHAHRGGWNCIHSWLPINLAWDDELRALLVDQQEPTEVAVDRLGKTKIRVFADGPRIARLEKQIPLERRGYVLFYDPPDADSKDGFVAIHQSWLDALTADRRTKRHRRLTRVREEAERLAAHGHSILLTTKQPADLIVDGEERYLPALD